MNKIILLLIRFYTIFISPYLHLCCIGCGCRFVPSCSEYMKQAIETHGLFRGFYIGIMRLLRCHPWNQSDILDPIPPNIKNHQPKNQ